MSDARVFTPLRPDPRGKETILEQIVAQRRTRLDALHDRIAHVHDSDLTPSTRSLYDALGAGDRGGHHFIMECKAASPSLGLIRDPYHPGEIARIYSHYANAISVLCEPDFFGGDYDDLMLVSASTHLPVLCKDFIVDPIQIKAARYFGADAILLMLSVLDDNQYAELAAYAASLGLDVLTETSTEDEVNRALSLEAKIVGINNRNLRDLTIDVSRSARLSHHIPPGIVVVSESGIRDHATVRTLGPAVSGFLVGSQLTSQPDVDVAARQLLYGEAKVCGLTHPASARMAYAAGATYGGLIFAEKSPRKLTVAQAARIAEAAPQLQWVAVMVDEDPEHIADMTRQIMAAFAQTQPAEGRPLPRLAAVQVHVGARTTENSRFDLPAGTAFVDALRQALPSQVQLWRAFDMNVEADRDAAHFLAEDNRVDRLVLDSGKGGTGKSFDWMTIPSGCVHKLLIAGGIGPDNCAQAMATGAVGVDMNSLLEYPAEAHLSTPRKDLARIWAAFQNLARADQQQPTGMTKGAIHGL